MIKKVSLYVKILYIVFRADHLVSSPLGYIIYPPLGSTECGSLYQYTYHIYRNRVTLYRLISLYLCMYVCIQKHTHTGRHINNNKGKRGHKFTRGGRCMGR